jgi:hypothetical protein
MNAIYYYYFVQNDSSFIAKMTLSLLEEVGCVFVGIYMGLLLKVIYSSKYTSQG